MKETLRNERIIPGTKVKVSPIVMGCMRLVNLGEKEAEDFIINALEKGVNFFDHGDIYGAGQCEALFGKAFGAAMKDSGIKREDVFIQTKCGIVPGKMYDLSKKHIVESLNQSLKRLNLDYVDSLLLHRPDALVEPEEVAAAFDELYAEGKVRYFGVSNHNPGQIKLLQKYVARPLVFNQLQLGPAFAPMISQGLQVNMVTDGGVNRDGGVLDFCRLENIMIQAWSPFQYGFISGPFFKNPDFAQLTETLKQIGEKYGVSETTIAAAWILRHPAKMQVIAGTMNKEHFDEISKASQVDLSREDWYKIYMAGGNLLP